MNDIPLTNLTPSQFLKLQKKAEDEGALNLSDEEVFEMASFLKEIYDMQKALFEEDHPLLERLIAVSHEAERRATIQLRRGAPAPNRSEVLYSFEG
jgi:hypothetical protein